MPFPPWHKHEQRSAKLRKTQGAGKEGSPGEWSSLDTQDFLPDSFWLLMSNNQAMHTPQESQSCIKLNCDVPAI